jgi:6-phosphogluconolactonase
MPWSGSSFTGELFPQRLASPGRRSAVAVHVEVLPDPAAVARRGAELVAERARTAIAGHGRFTFAVSGGHTPWAMFAKLVGEPIDWEKVTIFQVDERVAPEGDPDRNLTHLRESLRTVAADVRPMPVDAPDLERAAEEYARSLPAAFDLIHLGLGPDGHVASLVPGDPVLEVTDRKVAITRVYQRRRRMTLTYAVLEGAPAVLWLITGADKARALHLLRASDSSIPAGRVRPASGIIIADEAAAGG